MTCHEMQWLYAKHRPLDEPVVALAKTFFDLSGELQTPYQAGSNEGIILSTTSNSEPARVAALEYIQLDL